ncbi:MAG: hypothetical protein GC159_14230 [Phycisphaera sp.]|nr:hypothetical protein [Phycisphaera sp.]
MNRVRLDTTYGDIVIELWHNVAPRTADHFLQLVHNGFFDGLSFHRVVPNFLIQAGCPKGDGTGGCGYTVAAEFNDTPHDRGTVSMARRPNEADSASSQFFISLNRENCAHLDGQYTVFGKVLDRCMDTVEQIAQSALTSPELGVPEHPVQIMHCFEDWDDHHAYDHDYHHGMDNPAPEESAAASDTGETGDKPTEA